MRGRGAVATVVALAALAGPAQAATPELSIERRLEDRREVAAGTRAQVLGFQDGRFYANSWHTTGEMGGIISPPLKLLDSLYFGVEGKWAGQATRFTSGWGYMRYDLPPIDDVRLQRTDVVPDGRRGALLGLTLRSARSRTVDVMVDAHSELMTQYPWGFDPPPDRQPKTPHASDNAQDRGDFRGGTLVFRDTGRMPGESRNHSYTAIVGSDERPEGGDTGPGHHGPFGAGRRCTTQQRPEPMPKQCDDGPFGRGTGGQLQYQVRLKGGPPDHVLDRGRRLGQLRRRGRARVPAPDRRSRGAARGQARGARAAGPLDARRAAGQPAAAGVGRLGQAEPRRPHADGERPRAAVVRRGPALGLRGACAADQLGRRRLTRLPVALRHRRRVHGARERYARPVRVDQGPHALAARRVRDPQRRLGRRRPRGRRGRVDLARQGHPPDRSQRRGHLRLQHGRDRQVPGRGRADLALDRRRQLPRRDARLHAPQPGVRAHAARRGPRRLARGQRQRRADRHGGGEARQHRVLHPRPVRHADMARSAGQESRADEAESRADALVARFEQTWWLATDQQYADSLRDPGNVPVNQKHWIGVNPMEVELYRDGEFVPGLGVFEHGNAALATRENSCYSGERPGNLGLFHTGCGGGPNQQGEFAIFSLNTAVQAVGEGNYGRTGDGRQRRYTDANAETQFSQPATDFTPDEQPGAMPEIMPSLTPTRPTGNPPNIDRCWTCRSMFMQAWGHYGNAWPVVHQQLGVRPHLGRDFLEIVPQVPVGEERVSGANIRLGGGEADVLASRDGNQYTTITDTDDTRVREFRIGHTLPHGSQVASAQLDGRPADYTTRATNRGMEVWVRADADRRHTLVVTAVP